MLKSKSYTILNETCNAQTHMHARVNIQFVFKVQPFIYETIYL